MSACFGGGRCSPCAPGSGPRCSPVPQKRWRPTMRRSRSTGSGRSLDGPVDVTTIGRHVAPRGVRPHTTRVLHPADWRRLRGIPVTSPARALLEVAAELTPRELANAVERAQVDRLVTKAQIVAAIERSPRRSGAAALRALAEDPAFTRSRAERKLVALLRAARLPEPVFNVERRRLGGRCALAAAARRARVRLLRLPRHPRCVRARSPQDGPPDPHPPSRPQDDVDGAHTAAVRADRPHR